MPNSNNITDFWVKNPLTVKKYQDNIQLYTQLCGEVEYIIKRLLDTNNIKYALITSRTKTLNSFIEKIGRKDYTEPFSEIKDISGIRIVAMYKDDIPKIQTIIETEFNIEEKNDIGSSLSVNHFGYDAIHYVVSLGPHLEGIRYDYLKTLYCEIQVRTILQDAWAIVAHHLTYKAESQVPAILQRKMNRLVGLFETIDEQFCDIKNEREKYIQQLEDDHVFILNEKINLDSIEEYCKWRFSNTEIRRENLSKILSYDGIEKYQNIQDIENVANRFSDAITDYLNIDEDHFIFGKPTLNAASILDIILACDNKTFFEADMIWSKSALDIINKYKTWN